MRLRETAGFTLVELVLTVGVIALMSSMAALALPPMLDSYRLREATSVLTNAIREAQVQALREGSPWRVRFDADGGGYALQRAATSTHDVVDCGTYAGWRTVRSERFHTGVRIDTSTMSRPCVGFSSGGQTGWPNPEVLLSESSAPFYGGGPRLMLMVDGVKLDQANLPNDPRLADEPTVTWRNTSPVLVFDFDELRMLHTPCLGLYSFATYRYPTNIRVEASVSASYASAAWTTVYDGPGPTNPSPGQKARTCFNIPVNASYRYVRITLTRNGTYVVLDEFDASDLTYVVRSAKSAKRLVVGSVTGRVSVEPA